MVYLALAVGCSLAIGMIFKHAGRLTMDRTALLTVNYLAAVAVAGGLLSLGTRAPNEGLVFSPTLLGLGIGTGALLIAGFFVLSVATDVAGMSLAIGVMRVSVVIPFLVSWLVWNEPPTLGQGIGLLLASAAFFMIARKESAPAPVPAGIGAAGERDADSDSATLPEPSAVTDAVADAVQDTDPKVFGVLALTFLSGGAVDVTMKTFEEVYGADNSRVLFLLLAFGIAFLIGLAVVLWRGLRKGIWPDRRTILWGILLGVINYGSLEFILRAIEALPGTVVFPLNNIAIVVLAAVLGVYVWGERLSPTNRVGLSLAVIALVLLNL